MGGITDGCEDKDDRLNMTVVCDEYFRWGVDNGYFDFSLVKVGCYSIVSSNYVVSVVQNYFQEFSTSAPDIF